MVCFIGNLVGSLTPTSYPACFSGAMAISWRLPIPCGLGLSVMETGNDLPAPVEGLHFHFTLGSTSHVVDLA